jgi:divalent metal cation (Fe/Co/Zn/Cd) transporter
MTAQPDGEEQLAVQRRTTLLSIAAAGLLVLLKLGVGLATGSLGLISAGIESSGDVVAATLTFFTAAPRTSARSGRRRSCWPVVGSSPLERSAI